MSGYTKLFSSIVTSSIWCEDDKTRLVWVTMLALASKDGVVEAAIPGLANAARVPIEDCRAAVARLLAPDPDSRTTEFEGRRIEPCDGGWRLLNHAKFRAKLSRDDRNDYQRVKQAEYRSPQYVPKPSNRRVTDTGMDGKPASAAYKAQEAAGIRAEECAQEKASACPSITMRASASAVPPAWAIGQENM